MHRTPNIALVLFFLAVLASVTGCGNSDTVTVKLITPMHKNKASQNLMQSLTTFLPTQCLQDDMKVMVMNSPSNQDPAAQTIFTKTVPVYTDLSWANTTNLPQSVGSPEAAPLAALVNELKTNDSVIDVGPIELTLPRGLSVGIGIMGQLKMDYQTSNGEYCLHRTELGFTAISDVWEWVSYSGFMGLQTDASGTFGMPLYVAPRIVKLASVSYYYDVSGTLTACTSGGHTIVKTIFNTVDPNPPAAKRADYVFIQPELQAGVTGV